MGAANVPKGVSSTVPNIDGKLKIGIVKNWAWPDLLRQTPGRSGRWGDCEFQLHPWGDAPEWVVVLNNRFESDQIVCAPSERVVALMQEPYVPGFTDWMDEGLDAYSRVFSSHEPRACRRWSRSHPAVAWHVDRDYDWLCASHPEAKDRVASWVCGNAKWLPGHADRLGFLTRVQRELRGHVDLYGRAVSPVDDKWDALAPYRYSLAVENTVRSDYWTEKLADCFLSWTCPIYHGAPNIHEYFPADSMIRIDIRRPREALQVIRQAIEEGDRAWQNRLDAIGHARRLVLDRWQFFPHVSEQLRQLEHAAGPVRLITIGAHRSTLRGSIRRRWQRLCGTARRLVRRG